MRAARAVLALSLGTLFLALGGCARQRVPLPPAVPLDAPEVRSLLTELVRRGSSVERYQGFVRVRGRGPEGGFEARLVVIFERPFRLRVELLGAFGATRWSAVADESEITAYFPGRRQFLREADVAEVVARLLGLRLTSEEVIAILAGNGIPLDADGAARGQSRGASRSIELLESAGTTLEVDASGQVRSARSKAYRVTYPTPWLSRGRQIPDEVTIENDDLRATLTAEDVDVNVGLDPEAFRLELPTDAERLRPAEVGGEAVFVPEKRPGSEEPR